MRLSCTLSANHRLIPWLLWIPKIWYVWYWRLSKPSVSFCEDHYVAESWQCWPSAQLLQNSASHAPDNRESRYRAWRVWGVIQSNIDIKRYSLCQRSSGKIVEIHSEPFLNFTKLSTWYRKEHPRNVFYWKIHTARMCLQFLFKDAFQLFGLYIEVHAHSTLWVSISSR